MKLNTYIKWLWDSTYGLINPRAEDCQDEERCDGWGEIAGDGLDVVEELAAVGRLNDWDPENTDDHEDEDKDSEREG